MLDEDAWRFINTFAPWFSAIGSLAAVVVALTLARRQHRIHLHVLLRVGSSPARIGDDLESRSASPPPEACVEVSNRGLRKAAVRDIRFSIGWLRRREFRVSALHGHALPAPLEDGERVLFYMPVESLASELVRGLPKSALLQFLHLRAHSVSAIVHTTAGVRARGRAQRTLCAKLVAQAKKRTNA
jgi:hypothetical protein